MKLEIVVKNIPEKCYECPFCKWINDSMVHDILDENIILDAKAAMIKSKNKGKIAQCSKFGLPIDKNVMKTTELDRFVGFDVDWLNDEYKGGKCRVSFTSTSYNNY